MVEKLTVTPEQLLAAIAQLQPEQAAQAMGKLKAVMGNVYHVDDEPGERVMKDGSKQVYTTGVLYKGSTRIASHGANRWRDVKAAVACGAVDRYIASKESEKK